MIDFRIMPAQGKIEKSGTRYGFVIPNHPLGCPYGKRPWETYRDTGKVYNQGDYIASWETFEIAKMAAYVLKMPVSVVQPVAVYVPESDGGWYDRA